MRISCRSCGHTDTYLDPEQVREDEIKRHMVIEYGNENESLRAQLAAVQADRDQWKQIQLQTDNTCCKLTTLNEKLTEERDALAKAQEWRPIQSIPKDGTRVLVCRVGGFGVEIAWHEETGATIKDYTHWMPLPETMKGDA